MEWQPQQGPLGQLTQCLKDSLSGHDIGAQKNAEEVSLPRRRNFKKLVADSLIGKTANQLDLYKDAEASENVPRYQQLSDLPLHMSRSAYRTCHGCEWIPCSKKWSSNHA